MCNLVLGSQSPRRKELLELAGYRFVVRSSEVEEVIEEGMTPEEAVLHLSQVKSESIELLEDEVLLTSDTVVSVDGRILGKPANFSDARSYLQQLSGRTHEVFTGVYLRTNEESCTFFVQTDVTFYDLLDNEIEWYLSTGEIWDKAGAYGIQGKGALFVEKIDGDYYSVVGLPISRVSRELRTFNVSSG
ncbi:Maf family protein [Halobacillus litoralis]|uniref:Maf family protein n=1 Tax=Halobacillus litoralis TaxID=45668 RepID=UPI00248FFC9E|nr:Maf family protein [Halobacillus litoralis]